MPLCASVYLCLVVTCWKGLTFWLSFVVSNCEFVAFPLVSWVRCGTWLYRSLIFAPLLTHLQANDMWMKTFTYMSSCSLPVRQCYHTCNMARNCLHDGHVIPTWLTFRIMIYLWLDTPGIFWAGGYMIVSLPSCNISQLEKGLVG